MSEKQLQDNSSFDFDYWATLYKDDPKKFEKQRLKVLEQNLLRVKSSYDSQLFKRLCGIQFRLDHTISGFKNPTARLNKMISVFWKQVDELRIILNQYASGEMPKKTKTKDKAEVFYFKKEK